MLYRSSFVLASATLQLFKGKHAAATMGLMKVDRLLS
jgi:hypothetical protein